MPRRRPMPELEDKNSGQSEDDFEALKDSDVSEDELAHTQMSFLDHLDELRIRMIRIAWGLLVCFIGAYFFKEQIYRFLTEPLIQAVPKGVELIYLDPTEAFFTYIKVSFLAAIVISAPWIFYQLWRFIAPGLYKRERRMAWPFVLSSSVLFIGGAIFCFMLVFPYAFQFLRSFETGQTAQDKALMETDASTFRGYVHQQVEDQLSKAGGAKVVIKLPQDERDSLIKKIEDDILEKALVLFASGELEKTTPGELTIKAQFTMRNYLSFVSTLLIAFGVIFEMPLVLIFMGRLGIVTSKALRKKRKYAILIMFVVGAFFTPPDPVTQCLMAVPLIMLYEISIWMVAATERKKAAREAEEEAELES